jgi:uncharacterized protein YbjT (DUF2867 family)
VENGRRTRRAKQFYAFLDRIADSNTNCDTVRLPPVRVRPEGADDVVEALVDVAVSPPVNGIVELAGPETSRCDQARTYGSWRSQLMHVRVQKSTRTTWPRRWTGPSGSELSHSVAPPSEGICRRPNTVT